MRLVAGIDVPNFSAVDLEGEAISPQTYAGRKWWLILSRFAACPFCSVRLHGIIERYKTVQAAGVDVLVVFPSKEKRVRQFSTKYNPPFRIVADPEQKVFEQFGSETSWSGEIRSAMNIPKVLEVLAQTRMNPLGIDDAPHRMPADYLIQADGKIGRVNYGENLDDGFSVQEVVEWARG